MRLLIPTIGTHLKLTADWTFQLHYERRNNSLRKALKKAPVGWDSDTDSSEPITFPKDTVLTVDRVYLRQQAETFDSITFRIHTCPTLPKGTKSRFWAKLADVNRIECEIDPATTPGMKGKSILGLGESRRFGDVKTYSVGDRVFVRGAVPAGVGVVVHGLGRGYYTVSLPSDVKGCDPVFERAHMYSSSSEEDPGPIVYGAQVNTKRMKPATAEEIAKDEAKRAKLQERREKAAATALKYLKKLYANPLDGDDLEIVRRRFDGKMEARTEYAGSKWSYTQECDVSELDYLELRRNAKRGFETDRILLAAAENPRTKRQQQRSWLLGAYYQGESLVLHCEHKVVAAVQQGYLDADEAKAVLPRRVLRAVSPEALEPRWVNGVPLG